MEKETAVDYAEGSSLSLSTLSAMTKELLPTADATSTTASTLVMTLSFTIALFFEEV